VKEKCDIHYMREKYYNIEAKNIAAFLFSLVQNNAKACLKMFRLICYYAKYV